MKFKIVFLILLLGYQLLIYSYDVETLTSHFDIEYEYTGSCSWFNKELVNVWKLTGLMHNEIYKFTLENPEASEIFDAIVYESTYHYNWEVIEEDPINPEWRWTGSDNGTDYFGIDCYRYDYSTLELGMNDLFALSISDDGGLHWKGDFTYAEIITSMDVSGLDLDCSNPVQYTLNDLANGGSAAWEIYQFGDKVAYGNGTVAIAYNFSDGAAVAKFIVSFPCDLESLTFYKNFWFGKPGQRPTWPTGNPTPIQADLFDYIYIYPQSDPKGATGCYWTASGSITRLTPPTASILVVEATSTGSGDFYLYGTNQCGTSTTPWHGMVNVTEGRGGGMKTSPIPADSYIEITFDEDKLAKAGLLKDDQSYDFGDNPYFRIVSKLGEVKLTQKYTGEKKTRINVSKLAPDFYLLQLVMENNVFVINILISR